MARNKLWLLIAACICTCYKNEMNRPEVFHGRLAQAIEEYRRPRSVAMPAYLDKYGNIGEGKMCRLSKLYVGYNIKYTISTRLRKLIMILFSFSRYPIIARFRHYASCCRRKPIASGSSSC